MEQNWVWLFYYFNFERDHEVSKSKSPCILLNKTINFNKNETESKMEIPHTVSERRTLCYSSCNNRKIKGKLWWVGARKRKKRPFFVPFILFEGNLLRFMLYLKVECIECIFRIYIHLHIKKHHFIHFCLFLKSRILKVF